MGYATARSTESLPALLVRENPAEYPGSPDPERQSSDFDAMETLSQEITLLSAQIESATQRLLELIERFDTARGWEWAGYRSCAEWLAHRTGIDRGAARERVRAARALRELPLIREALSRGELTFSKVRALTRVAEPDNESYFLELARESTAAELERMVRGWRLANARDEAERDELRHRNRCLSVFADLDGTYVVRGRLTPEAGAILMRAIDAASDALYSAEQTEAEEAMRGRRNRLRPVAEESEAAASRRRADALALLMERAMAVGMGRGAPGFSTPDASPPALSGSTAERYQVMVHVDLDTLRTPDVHPLERASERHGKRARKTRLDRIVEAAQAGEAKEAPARGAQAEGEGEGDAATCTRDHSHIEDTRVSAETSRRLCCDASVVRVGHGKPGEPLDLGRRTRTISPALRRALEFRDRGCRFPGCGSRFTDAHHLRHWADGGETSLRNCILLCRHHHRLVHEGGWTVLPRGEGRPLFVDPRGGEHFDGRWRAPEP